MGDLAGRGARAGFHDEHIGGVVAVGIFTGASHEGDGFAVGRPGRRTDFQGGIGKRFGFLGLDVEQVDVAVASGEQIALLVLLVSIAIDDDRLRRLRWAGWAGLSGAFTRGRIGIGIRVADNQRQPRNYLL